MWGGLAGLHAQLLPALWLVGLRVGAGVGAAVESGDGAALGVGVEAAVRCWVVGLQLGARARLLQGSHCKAGGCHRPGWGGARPLYPLPGGGGRGGEGGGGGGSSPCCSSSAFCRLRSSMSCWCVWFFRRMYWMYSVALSRIWARDACGNSGKRHGPDKDLSPAVGRRAPPTWMCVAPWRGPTDRLHRWVSTSRTSELGNVYAGGGSTAGGGSQKGPRGACRRAPQPHLLALQGGHGVTQAVEAVLDVVPPFALQGVVVGSFVCLQGGAHAPTHTHTHTYIQRGAGGSRCFRFPHGAASCCG